MPSAEKIELPVLTGKQRAFVDAYFVCNFNATKAAIRAGYSEKTAYSIGSENLKKPEITQHVSARMAEAGMAANEVIARLTLIGGVDIEDFIDIDDEVDYANESVIDKTLREANERLAQAYPKQMGEKPGWKLNLGKAKKHGKTHLIKSIKQGEFGPELLLHDSQTALNTLARHHGLLTDRVEQTGAALDILRDLLSAPLTEEEAEETKHGE